MAWLARLAHFAIEFGFCMSCRVLFIVLGKGVRRTAKEKVCALTNGQKYSSVSPPHHALIVLSLRLPLHVMLLTVLSSNSLQPTHGYAEEQQISDMVILDPGTYILLRMHHLPFDKHYIISFQVVNPQRMCDVFDF